MYINQHIPETEFLLSHLSADMRVLEYGSGGSTISIGARVAELVSMEHTPEWYSQVQPLVTANTNLVLVSIDQYVRYPVELANARKFDAIFIDGPNRVECASICHLLGHADTKVFIHDYNRGRIEKFEGKPLEIREENFAAEQYLEPVCGVLTMWMFRIKFPCPTTP